MYTDQLTEAFGYALQLHSNQTRKGTDIPYITHLMAVASIVGESGGDEDMVIAALLHDAVEDQGGMDALNTIREKYGDRVAEIVDGCTDAYTDPKPKWRQRKEDYIAHLDHASDEIRLVSASDKLHNARAIVKDLRTMGASLWDRFNGKREGTLWYYESLAAKFSTLGPKSIGAELERLVADMKRLG